MDLYQAATLDDTEAIRAAAEQGCDISTSNIDGKTPLWFAVQNGQSDACSLLITRGANIDAQNFIILEIAVQGGHADIVALLWPHCKAENEQRSLESAISLGFHEIADFLIGTGEFGYQHPQANGTNLLMGEGFPERDCADLRDAYLHFISDFKCQIFPSPLEKLQPSEPDWISVAVCQEITEAPRGLGAKMGSSQQNRYPIT